LRKGHRCLLNCRKDLTTVEFNQDERWITIERRDESGELAMVVCSLSDKRAEVPINLGASVQLALFGGEVGAHPPLAQLEAGRRVVTLDGAGAAIYIAKGNSR
jgi:hypothetical protein